MATAKHALFAALLLAAPFVACSSSTTPSASDAGAAGAEAGAEAGRPSAGLKVCLAGTCNAAQAEPYTSCLAAKCDAQYSKCYGAGHKSGTFAGAPCSDYQTCVQKCDCADDACITKCTLPDACAKCLIAELPACAESCTVPACAAEDAGKPVDSGVEAAKCVALAACCAQIDLETIKATCDDVVARGDGRECESAHQSLKAQGECK